MKVLVGILYSGEPQIKDCINSVTTQKNAEFGFFVINNLPKKEAHDELYTHFMDHNKDYELFLKLDADMIINRDDFFEYLIGLFRSNYCLDWLHIWIYDNFLDARISGLNVYRNCVKWRTNHNNLYTDRSTISNSIRESLIISAPDSRWVIHCPNPSDEQAFNFGFHRGIKAFQCGVKLPVPNSIHGTVIRRVFKSYLKNFNTQNLISIAAFYKALDYDLSPLDINKQSIKRQNIFDEIISQREEIKKIVFLDIRFWLIIVFGKIGYHFLYKYYKR